MKSLSRNQVLFKFLFSYVAILLIPLLLGLFFYFQTVKIVETDARETNLSLLEKSVSTIDKNMKEVDDLMAQFSVSANVQRMLDLESPLKDETNVVEIIELQKLMGPYMVLNSFIKMFYIYFSQGETVISPSESFIRMESFYGDYFKYDDLSFEKWQQDILTQWHSKKVFPAASITIGKKKSTMIAYMQSLTNTGIRKPKANIMVYIDEREIRSILDNLAVDDGGWAYISDREGNIITGIYSGENEINPKDLDFTNNRGYLDSAASGSDMLVSYVVSQYNGWTYVSAVPAKVVMAKADALKEVILLILAVSMLAGLIISYFLAYRNSKPILELTKMIRERLNISHDKSKDAYGLLNDTFSDLVASNKKLQEDLKHQSPVLKNTILYQLLSGQFNSREDAEASLAKAGIMVGDMNFVVLILSINDYNQSNMDDALGDLNMIKVIIKDHVENEYRENCHLYDMDFDKVAFLLRCQLGDKPDILDFAEKFANNLKCIMSEKYSINVSFTGSLADSLMNVNLAFYKARQALKYRTPSQNLNITWYRSSVLKEDIGYYYPIDVEMKIMDMAKAGNYEDVEHQVAMILRRNFINRRLPVNMGKQLINSVQGTMIRILEQVDQGKEDILSQVLEIGSKFDTEKDYTDIYKSISGVFRQICSAVKNEKQMEDADLIKQILEYISTNYMDSNMCLSLLATRFNVTESYLSRFFKEQTDENFSRYVERIRMEYALELLQKDNLPVAEVSRRVGYNSAHAFRRVFKRFYGKNPTE